MTTTHCLSVSVPTGQPAPAGRRAPALLLLASALLTGCAQLPPMVEQLQADKKTQIRLFVEDAPFKYTVPSAMDPAAGGIPLVALIGALAAVSVQHSLEGANARLAAAASEKKLAVDHRQAFVGELVRRLGQLGVTVEVVPVPYETNSLGNDRRFYKPSTKMVTLPTDAPVFSLNLDVGTCTFGAVNPCVRYAFLEMPPPARPAAPANSDIMRNPTTPPTTVRYRGVFGTAPDHAKPYAAELKKYASVDEAIREIAEFDAQFVKIVPRAVDDLVKLLEPRAPGATPAAKVAATP
ncbi:MAG: hypothetical protein ACK4VX_14600 [Polaromonas sp.]